MRIGLGGADTGQPVCTVSMSSRVGDFNRTPPATGARQSADGPAEGVERRQLENRAPGYTISGRPHRSTNAKTTAKPHSGPRRRRGRARPTHGTHDGRTRSQFQPHRRFVDCSIRALCVADVYRNDEAATLSITRRMGNGSGLNGCDCGD